MTRDEFRRRLEEVWREPASPSSRRLACLLGGALGDALGYRVEFKRWAEIEQEHGPAGIQLAACKGPLVVSDDTQMTLFTLEGMARAAGTAAITSEIREAYLDWYGTQAGGRRSREPRGRLAGLLEMCQVQAPGSTCLSALRQGGQGTVERPINNSKGCGGVMRTAPLGFLPGTVDDAALLRLGAEAAALTHGHPDGYLPAGAIAVLVRDALSEVPWQLSVAKVLELVRERAESDGTVAAIERAVQAAADGVASREKLSALGEGWVGEEALAVGLYAAMVAKSFAECIELAANHDGDSDSTASTTRPVLGLALWARLRRFRRRPAFSVRGSCGGRGSGSRGYRSVRRRELM
jgi:ADP-ribosylglycohydrolase